MSPDILECDKCGKLSETVKARDCDYRDGRWVPLNYLCDECNRPKGLSAAGGTT